MTNLPKIMLFSAKAVGAILITGAIVSILGTFENSPGSDTSGAFDSIRESIFALINQNNPGKEFETTEPFDETTLPSSESALQIKSNSLDFSSIANTNYEILENEQNLEKKSNSQRTMQFIALDEDLPKSMRKNIVDIGSGEIGLIEQNVIVNAIMPEDPSEIPSIKRLIVNEIDFNFESLDDLISIALEFGINNIPLEEHQLLSLFEHLENAEKEFNINTLNLQKIIVMGERVASFASLNEQIKKISTDLGGLPECQYHKPVLDINTGLEIVGYYQEFECHPELVEKMMEKIKTLPEWKKLSKTVYSP